MRANLTDGKLNSLPMLFAEKEFVKNGRSIYLQKINVDVNVSSKIRFIDIFRNIVCNFCFYLNWFYLLILYKYTYMKNITFV